MAASNKMNVLVANEYEDANEKTQTSFSQVGVAFPAKNDGFTVVITPGISVTGRLIVCKPKSKDKDDDGNNDS